MKCRISFYLIVLIAFSACKKSDSPSTTTPTPPDVVNTPFVPGNTLAVAKGTNMANPRVILNPDTAYTEANASLPKFKKLPVGFDDAIVSFFLPKGYMAVFAENSDGTGESASYVAAQSNIQTNLPDRLKSKVSFVRYIPVNNRTKKGVAFTDSNTVKTFNSSWYYGWSLNRPSFVNQQYVPMTWGRGSASIENVAYFYGRNDIDHLLSFNEPDNASQSNIPNIDTAVARYKVMLQSGLRLGSPAVTQDEATGAGKWLTNFMTVAAAQKARVDFIALHWYDWGNHTNNLATDSLTAQAIFNRFKNYVERVRAAYPNQKIWITEYNANPNRSSAVVHKYFMQLSTDWMNASSYVERYAYFFPSAVPAIDASGALTDVGVYWNNLSSPVSFPFNIE